MGNVSERRKQPPQVGVSVVILALGPVPQSDVGAGAASSGMGSTLWMPLVKRVRQPFWGAMGVAGRRSEGRPFIGTVGVCRTGIDDVAASEIS